MTAAPQLGLSVHSKEVRKVSKRDQIKRPAILLAVLLAHLLLSPTLPPSVGGTLVFGVMLAAAWEADGHSFRTRVAVGITAVPLAIIVFLRLFLQRDALWQVIDITTIPVVLTVMYIGFYFYCAWITLRSLLSAAEVGKNQIITSVTLYMLIALSWAHVYSLLYRFLPGSFNINVDPDPLFSHLGVEQLARLRLTYFSFITMATQGYGDVTPQNVLAQSLVCIQTVIGQFYVAIVVAYLISRFITKKAEL